MLKSYQVSSHVSVALTLMSETEDIAKTSVF
jgi:hypothetical protein